MKKLFANINARSPDGNFTISATSASTAGAFSFTLGDTEALQVFLTDGAGGYAAESGDGDYSIKVGIGTRGGVPTGGTFTVTAGNTSGDLAFDITAAALETALNARSTIATEGSVDVELASEGYYIATYRTHGNKTLPTAADDNLTPPSSVVVSRIRSGSSTVYEQHAYRLARLPVAFQDTFTTITNGWEGTLSLNNDSVKQLLGQSSSVETVIELELTDGSGGRRTIAAGKAVIFNEVIDSQALIPENLSEYYTSAECDALFLTPSSELGGDVSGTPGAVVLDSTGVTAGTYGDGSSIPVVTVDAKGRVTGATTVAVTIPAGDAIRVSVSQSSHGLSVGDVIKYTGTAYAKAQGDTAANAESVGIVDAVSSVNAFTFIHAGKIATLSGLTAGSLYFVSAATAGLLTTTEPGAGNVSKPMLLATSSTAGIVLAYRGVLIPLALTASRAMVTDGSGSPTASSITSTELGLLSGKTTLATLGANTFTGNQDITVTESASSGTENAQLITVTVNQSGTASYCGSKISITESATGSGTKAIVQGLVGSVVKYSFESTGRAYFYGDSVRIVPASGGAGLRLLGASASGQEVRYTGSGVLNFVEDGVATRLTINAGNFAFNGASIPSGMASGFMFANGTSPTGTPSSGASLVAASGQLVSKTSGGALQYLTSAFGSIANNGTLSIGSLKTRALTINGTTVNVVTLD